MNQLIRLLCAVAVAFLNGQTFADAPDQQCLTKCSSAMCCGEVSQEERVLEFPLEVPSDLPDEFSVEVWCLGEHLTLVLEKNSVFGENTRFLVVDEDGERVELQLGKERSYLGRVLEDPAYAVSAVIGKDGLRASILRPNQESILIEPAPGDNRGAIHRVSIEDGRDCDEVTHRCGMEQCVSNSCVSHREVAASVGKVTTSVFSFKKPNAKAQASSSATLPPSRVMDVLEYEIGVEIGSPAFLNNYGGDIDLARSVAQGIPGNLDARYLRACGIKYRLGTVIIRTSAGADPFQVANGNDSGGLSAFRNYWNANPGEVGNTHDLAVYHVRASPSGLAYVNSVGTSNRYALSASNGPTSWADGTLAHEFGHSWSLGHYNSNLGNYFESKPRNGNGSNAAGGEDVFVSIMHGGGSHNIGRLCTGEANQVYGVRERKRNFGDLVANPGPIPPFGHRDDVETRGGPLMIDVIANDYDANNDVLDVHLLDTVSQKGGQITLSTGTGPGGRNQLIYTPPLEKGEDFFHYIVCDSTGRTDWGAVYVTNLGSFAESFAFGLGELAGEQNSGNVWTFHGGSGAANVVPGSLPVSTVDQFAARGASIEQTSNSRYSLPLSANLAGGTDNSVVYISFIQQLQSADSSKAQLVEFWNGSASDANTAFSFGTDGHLSAPDYGLLIDKGGANISLDVGSPDTVPHFIVLKLEYGEGDDDRISVFVDPGEIEPAMPNASSEATDLAFNRLGFGAFSGGGQKLDEIRIGPSYQAVVPVEVDELYFEESFSYGLVGLTGQENQSGEDWNVNSAGGEALITSETLLPAGVENYVASGGCVSQTNGNRHSIELTGAVVGGEAGTTRYISFLQKFESMDPSKTQFVEFWNGGVSDGNIAFSYGTDQNDNAPEYGLITSKDAGQGISLDLGSPDSDVHLVVLKIEYGDADQDVISVYLDPDTDEPLEASATGVASDLVFDRVGFGCFQGGSQKIDEIRIGSSFRAVVPVFGSGPLFEEGFEYDGGTLYCRAS